MLGFVHSRQAVCLGSQVSSLMAQSVKRAFRKRGLFLGGLLAVCFLGSSLDAKSPTAAQALGLKPIQKGVRYDTPKKSELAGCTIEVEGGGWVVRAKSGALLRKFIDTNNDNVVDRWSYFRDGIEVYRDVDSDFNGKPDQYRWLHTAGIRWGIDADKDGKIDYWKIISAQEVAEEAVRAIISGDEARFKMLLPTEKELASLGRTTALSQQIAKLVQAAPTKFKAFVKTQKRLTADSKFVDFGADRPGTIPAGTDGFEKDLVAYDGVSALIVTNGKQDQIYLGCLVQIGKTWKVIDAPKFSDDASNSISLFYPGGIDADVQTLEAISQSASSEVQTALAQLEKLDQQAMRATGKDLIRLTDQRIELIEKLITQAKTKKEKSQWLAQLADVVSATAQTGGYPQGSKKLAELEKVAIQQKLGEEAVAHVRFRRIFTEYMLGQQQKDADFSKIQKSWIESLELFVKKYPSTPDTSEAALQLAIAYEFSGNDKDAAVWYEKVAKEHGSSSAAEKAAGAARRLRSEGKPMQLSGQTLSGKRFDIKAYRKKVVLIQYWATWSDPSTSDHAFLKELQKKYGRQGFAIVGVNVDDSEGAVRKYLNKNPLSWSQLYESGGLDGGRLANEMGVLTVPLMLLVDRKGNVIRRSVQRAELEKAIQAALK